jgi:hypothetical protein
MRITGLRKQLTAIIERENNGYVSLCPELDIARGTVLKRPVIISVKR